MDRIAELQYENLRKCFNENLVNPILGEGYYNMAMDVYKADLLTTQHIKMKYEALVSECKIYQVLLVISVVSAVALIFK